MQGAREYAELFGIGIHNYVRLRIEVGQHARGKTFRIYVTNDSNTSNYIEVYGVIGGQPGWTEFYGWIHEGLWCEYFKQIVEQKQRDCYEEEMKRNGILISEKQKEAMRVDNILSNWRLPRGINRRK